MLTPNQIKAAELLSQGCSHQEVADACKVSRRTILRWLNQNDFKNLSFGLIHRQRAAQQVPPLPPPTPERHRQSSGVLTPQDLVGSALEAIRDILENPEVRACDRLKAASLILDHQKSKIMELQAVGILVEAGWLSDEILEAVVDAGEELNSKMKSVFVKNIHDNKKSLLQVPEEGNFDVSEDEFDDDEFEADD